MLWVIFPEDKWNKSITIEIFGLLKELTLSVPNVKHLKKFRRVKWAHISQYGAKKVQKGLALAWYFAWLTNQCKNLVFRFIYMLYIKDRVPFSNRKFSWINWKCNCLKWYLVECCNCWKCIIWIVLLPEAQQRCNMFRQRWVRNDSLRKWPKNWRKT